MWFTKARRAQSAEDFETWIGGGAVPTLNAFDNGDTRATVLIGDETDPSYTLDRTGGQAVAYSIREDAKANTFSATETDTALTVQAHQPSVQSHHAQLFIADSPIVRRLTPVECERLQGFPDNWTDDQADTNRYKQMGNAVAVPVVDYIIKRLVTLNTESSSDTAVQ